MENRLLWCIASGKTVCIWGLVDCEEVANLAVMTNRKPVKITNVADAVKYNTPEYLCIIDGSKELNITVNFDVVGYIHDNKVIGIIEKI